MRLIVPDPHVPYRIEQSGDNHFAAVRRADGAIIRDGFSSYVEGWTWLIPFLDAQHADD
jgi:hypothetical protein